MKTIRLIIGAIIWVIPLGILFLVLHPDINVKVLALTAIAVYTGIKSSDDVKLFHKWFKSKLR